MTNIFHTVENGIYIIEIHGELTLGPVEELSTYIETCLRDKNIKGIVFNLENLEIMDSTGIAFFVIRTSMLQKANVKMAICLLPDKHIKKIKIMSLHKVLNIHATIKEAIRSFQ